MSAVTVPKILIIDLAKGFGGASSRVLSLLENLPTEQVALAGLKNSPIVQSATEIGASVHIVGTHKADPRILLRLVDIIKEGDYQVIDTHNIQAKFWGSLAASITRRALVSTIHSWYAHEHGSRSLRGKLYTRLELLTNWKLGEYITVSANDQQALIRAKIKPANISLIYNAVAIEPEQIPEYGEQLQSQFGIPQDAVICTTVGRLVPVKGYDILIQAFSQIAAEVPRLHCLIVGDGELYTELQAQIREFDLKNRIYLAGYQNHETVLAIVKASQIFVMPSRYEGTPIALLEAAALGCSLVASNTGGIPELVTNGKHALLVSPEDADALAQALMKIIHDPKMATQLGLNAQKRVQEQFSLNSMVQTTEQVYKKVWDAHQENTKKR